MAVSQTDLARAAEMRRAKGWRWCEKRGVGATRRGLGNPLPANVALLMERRDPRFTAHEQQQFAAEIWQAFCRECMFADKCPMAKR